MPKEPERKPPSAGNAAAASDTRDVVVSKLAPRSEPAAALVLARAFRDGPMTRAVVGPSAQRRMRSNRHAMRQALRGTRDLGLILSARIREGGGGPAQSEAGRTSGVSALVGAGEAAGESRGADECLAPQGVLVALAPGAFPLEPPSLAAQLVSAVVQGFGVATRWGEVYRALAAAHPGEPHWYLSLLGTLPEHQRRGVGSALLDAWLEHVDSSARADRGAGADGAASYLETDLASNVAFYARVGFEVRQELRVFDTRVWCLWRRARCGSPDRAGRSPEDPRREIQT